jgi:anaerobic ribonucleoside-triphosphate reductase activating protein
MRFSYPQIYLQEVPGEISLGISISGCQINCKGCHSKETWNPTFGTELNIQTIDDLITKNKRISCILFYGGEWDRDIIFLSNTY